MRFEELPPEIFTMFLSYEGWGDPGFLLLWKTGNRLLRSKLENRGIHRAIYEDNHRRHTVHWPSAIKEWKLTILFIRHYGSFTYGNSSLHQELNSLPATITRLDFIWPGAFKDVFPSQPLTPQKLSMQTLLGDQANQADQIHLSSDNEPIGYGEDGFAFAKTFPHLNHFFLGSNYEQFLPHVYSLLPRSLDSLNLSHTRHVHISSFAELPPQMTRLYLPYSSITEQNIHTLPKTITNLFDSSCFTFPALQLLRSDPSILPNLTNPKVQ